jgi:hypothetical protein
MKMPRYIPLYISIVLTLLVGGPTPSPLQTTALQKELRELTQRGLTYRFLSPEEGRLLLGTHADEGDLRAGSLIEIKEEWSGFTRIKTLHEPSVAEIYAWADTHGVPIIEINPALLDTSQWVGWYNYWTQVPLSGTLGIPLVAGDFDNNGLVELYGAFRDYGTDFMTRVYEIDTNGTPTLRHTYEPRWGQSRLITDMDQNSLREVSFSLAGFVGFFEQSDSASLPLQLKLVHDRYAGSNLDPGTSTIHVGFFDGDSIMDILYKGSEIDSVTMEQTAKFYVAEYNPTVNDFVRVWSIRLEPPGQGGFVAGFGVGDFDGDGRADFVASHLRGNVYVIENTGDNAYALVWQDSLPFVNVFYQTAGDVDGDGKDEFFVGATMSNGNWTTVYKADSNNHYSPKVILHLLSGGSGDEPVYLTRDVDGNGRLELVIASGNNIYVFKPGALDSYYLWHYKRENLRVAIQYHDMNGDGRQDLIVNKLVIDASGLRLFADVYLAAGVVHVDEDHNHLPITTELLQNYPNPFNPATVIRFSLPANTFVTVTVYDVLGKEVKTLVHGEMGAGQHLVEWNPEGMASGVYFYRLATKEVMLTRKMLFLQ